MMQVSERAHLLDPAPPEELQHMGAEASVGALEVAPSSPFGFLLVEDEGEDARLLRLEKKNQVHRTLRRSVLELWIAFRI